LPPLAHRPDAIPRFSLATDSDHVAHPVARRVLTILQDLRRRARATTPALLLAEAVERLAVQPILSACHNQFLQQMQAPLSQLLKLSFSFSSRHPLTGKGSLGLHEEVLLAIEQRDGESASLAMETLIRHANEHMRSVVARIRPGQSKRRSSAVTKPSPRLGGAW
jgi:DNA-binding FadR family transcriptional regulator